MKMKDRIVMPVLIIMLITLGAARVSPQATESIPGNVSPWHLSFQYLGLTFHPGGGGSPEVYPLKFEKKGYLVPEVGAAANLDYRLSESFFFRFTAALYKDCAFITAGCIHTGPRIQYSWGDNSVNAGIGPIFSFRGDWHRFKEYQDDEFYGDRVRNGWQYRFFPTAIELEYLHRINDSTELQWSVIPGAPLVITFMFGVRFKLARTDAGKQI
ncbi:MAG: hypothetical protein ACYC9O_15890 [Candidatus Latescibacterota bacterium]